MSCSETLCETWCLEVEWNGEEAEAWGRREVTCDDDGRCLCRDFPCDDDNCHRWCREQADGGSAFGYCELFTCRCSESG